jgi:hypothetical protein
MPCHPRIALRALREQIVPRGTIQGSGISHSKTSRKAHQIVPRGTIALHAVPSPGRLFAKLFHVEQFGLLEVAWFE